jgi:hypothetical protein
MNPEMGPQEKGLINADDLVKFVYRMNEYIGPKEKYGDVDDVIDVGLPFDEIRPDGTPSYQFHHNSSLVDVLKTATASSVVALASIPLRTVEVAIGTSKVLRAKHAKDLKDETFQRRYAGIPEVMAAQAEKELALERAYQAGILERPSFSGHIRPGLSGSYYYSGLDGGYDDRISSLLLGYTTQATGNPNLEIGKLKDEVGPLLPNSVERGAQLFKAGRDAGTAIHEYLTEQRILNQRRFRGLISD